MVVSWVAAVTLFYLVRRLPLPNIVPALILVALLVHLLAKDGDA
jgi:uncharacterized membrane protein YqgA involved in biofilm formation